MQPLADGKSSSELPVGTVTFLFTDIEGSTKLLDRLGESYTQLLADQRVILRGAFDKYNGREIDTQGDSFFASFPRATDAVAAVVEIQRSLAEHQWPEDTEVRLRMGLHTGEPWLVEEGYVGMDVHRAARIGHVGYGGQVLLSETTTALIRDDLPEGVTLLNLGYHVLKDMRRPEHIHQLVIEDLLSDFPPIKSLEALPPNAGVGELEAIVRKRDVGPCPYRGLVAFQESDALFFFGREDFTALLEDSIQSRQMVAVIIGPSGSGKSSVVFAGLLPNLLKDDGWLTLQIRPGSSPFLSLSGALVSILEPTLQGTRLLLETQKIAEMLKAGDISLYTLVERILAQEPGGERLFIVIDQFEELFTLTLETEERRSFMEELLDTAEKSAARRPAPIVFLLTLRADFMGQALAYRPFADALQEGSLMLGPMNRAELKRAIEKPAELQGAAFETGLVERLLDDVGDEPGNLPLLEFALTLLWERMDLGWMTHAMYDEIGRVEGALARYADEIYAGLVPQEQSEARRAFIQLVQPGQGTEDTRRVATREELVGVEWDLIQFLAGKRLVVTGRNEIGAETVEVVHEALIRGWGYLREWIETDRAFRSWQEGLRSNMRQWDGTGKDEGALLRGVPLAQAEEWQLARGEDVSSAELAFIQASLELSQSIQARRNRRRRNVLTGLAAGFLLAVLLSIFALSQRGTAVTESKARGTQQAIAESHLIRAEEESDGRATQQAVAELEWARAEEESNARATQQAIAEDAVKVIATQQAHTAEQAREALARNLAASSLGKSNIDPQLGLLLALEAADQTYAVDRSLLPEAQAALYQTIQDVSRLAFTIPPQDGGIPFISFSADSSRLIARYFRPGSDPRLFPNSTTTIIWDALNGDLLHTLPEGIAVDAWPFTPHIGIGELVEDQLILSRWDISDGKALPTINLALPESAEADDLVSLVLNPDATQLIAVWKGGQYVQVWDLETVSEVHSLNFVDFMLYTYYFLGGEGSFNIGLPSYASISAGGTHLYAIHPADFRGGTGQVLTIRSPVTAEVLTAYDTQVSGLGDQYSNLSISPDETMLAVITDNYIDIKDLNNGKTLSLLVASPDTFFNAIAYSQDSSLLATASADGIIKIWDVAHLTVDGSINHIVTLSHPGTLIHDLQFSPDGNRLATASADGGIRVWNIGLGGGMKLPYLARDLVADGEAPVSIALSPDGKQLALASHNGYAAIYNTDGAVKLFQIAASTSEPVNQIDYSPDGSTIATCRFAGSFQIWDAESGVELLRLEEYTEGSCSFVFHPDGLSVTLGFFKNGTGWHQQLTLPPTKVGTLIEMDPLRTYEWSAPHLGETISLAMDGQSSLLVVVSEEGELFIWDATIPIVVTTGEGSFTSMLMSPENVDALLVRESRGYLEAVWGPTDTDLVVTGIDGSLSIFSSEDLQTLRLITAHEGRITAAAMSHDGLFLATSGLDHFIRMWDLKTGRLLLSLPGQVATITDLAFSPDGKQLYAAGEDGTVRPYLLDADELIDLALASVTRSLTGDECREYLHQASCPAP